ncbi:coproporphyrinogen dehydrogenase HemZ [Aminipila butyrica]|uniref:Coproporphyrinogen dehydrogenase HemZ n=1 Tax=Aminipila butyrica TaxID=433296 RepID=A0A858BWJ8_9FIRM|nr:coproporphyrinogen dehydrogenase HemZ [Aminipila butyrica]QIB69455.1 coproporphyrinogen dehydrogenase HemZ [Aminipila butyrica]
MYKIILNGITNKYEYDALIKVFLQPEEYVLICDEDLSAENAAETKKVLVDSVEETPEYETLSFNYREKNELKQDIYRRLSVLTGLQPEWGIHTGVRPVKLVGELVQQLGSLEQAADKLKHFYLFNDEKIKLLCDTYRVQQSVLKKPTPEEVGLYVGIPFCPTRCLYCSFTSNQSKPEAIQAYMEALHREIRHTGEKMHQTGLFPESVYIGGGTPTSLTASQLEELLSEIEKAYDLSRIREFTVEAGRPDTITWDKLHVLKAHGVERISINPQTMQDKTLELIGRSHSSQGFLEAFAMAREVGIQVINTDIIAGLPEETLADFANTLDTMIGLGAENITVHTLAVKRASRLIDVDRAFHYKQARIVKDMLALSKEKLGQAGYRPYYLYRQKHMAGSLENVGYAKEGSEGIYNIRIMEEGQTIVALGAGGISKACYPAENRLERVPNVSNFEIYMDRLEDMLQRKDENLFRR